MLRKIDASDMSMTFFEMCRVVTLCCDEVKVICKGGSRLFFGRLVKDLNGNAASEVLTARTIFMSYLRRD